MRKLKLQIEKLEVETFGTSDARAARRGTVRAESFQPVSEPFGGCFDTEITGPCCEYTWVSCRPTGCPDDC